VTSKLAADVPVMMSKPSEGITICTVYPAEDPKKPHECAPRGKGRLDVAVRHGLDRRVS
jgi:hypothetical protein